MVAAALDTGIVRFSAGDFGRPLLSGTDAGHALLLLTEKRRLESAPAAAPGCSAVLMPGHFTTFRRFAEIVQEVVTASVLAPPGGVALEPVEEGTPAFLAARCESVQLATTAGFVPDAAAVDEGLRETARAALRTRAPVNEDDASYGPAASPASALADALSRLREASTNEDAVSALETIIAGLASGSGYAELLDAVTSATGEERWFGAWMSLVSTLKARIVPEGASPVGSDASGELIGFTDTTVRLVEAVAFFKEERRACGQWPKLQYSVMGYTVWPGWYLSLVPKRLSRSLVG